MDELELWKRLYEILSEERDGLIEILDDGEEGCYCHLAYHREYLSEFYNYISEYDEFDLTFRQYIDEVTSICIHNVNDMCIIDYDNSYYEDKLCELFNKLSINSYKDFRDISERYNTKWY